ncbi:MAG: hypothetical protein U0W24_14430 [Bacteroidales bacterium]
MTKRILISIAIFLMLLNLSAQQENNVKSRKVQVTFAYPVGSNGSGAMQYSNNFSFNILYGLNGGVNGAEIGSIFNYNKGEVKGFQLAGVSNVNTGNSKGFLLGGVSNTVDNSTSGMLISGVINILNGNSKGFLLSGVSNIVKDSSTGASISGVVNILNGNSKGFLLSGVSNIVKDSLAGASIAGVINYTNQCSKGFHLSTLNICINDFNGFQLGVFNYSRKINGVQLGVINLDGNAEKGFPIGVLSIVKDGLYEIEMAAGEVIYANLNYKMGVDRIYTIYKLGYSSYNNHPVYSAGLGFGSNLSFSEKQKLCIDLSCNMIVFNNNWDGELNMLNKADFNYKYHFSDKVSLLIGPSFNLYITDEMVDGTFGTLKIPYTFYSKEWQTRKLSMWFGLNAGLNVKI